MRAASTYRAARRNAATVWEGAAARIEPYLCKPPILKFNWNNLTLPVPKSPLVSRKVRTQPKVYRAGIDAKRRARQWDALQIKYAGFIAACDALLPVVSV